MSFRGLDFQDFQAPTAGEAIRYDDGKMIVPDKPVIPFIEGDGIGADITPVMKEVVDAAVAKAYGSKRQIQWFEVFMGEKCYAKYSQDGSLSTKGKWLHPDSIKALEYFKVSIKGPLATPIGKGFRSLNVAIRQTLDLYACLRPVKWFGNPTPMLHPEYVDMTIFRENTEDIYAGIEFQSGTEEAKKVIEFLQEEMHVSEIRFPETSAIGIKPVSKEGSQRLIRRAFDYAIEHDRDSVTLVHKGNIMKFTEGGFLNWGYELAKKEYKAILIDGGPWMSMKSPKTGKEIIIKDVIADAFLQQILLRSKESDVIATLNLNGDYISDALAAMVGGIGMAPGANLRDDCAVFEATHGTAPGYAGLDKVNPSSLILSAKMMLKHIGWTEAGDLISNGIRKAVEHKIVTQDLARLMDDSKEVSCSDFRQEVIKNIKEA